MQTIEDFLFLMRTKKIKEKVMFQIELKDQIGQNIIYTKTKVSK